MGTGKLSPMMKQYYKLKREYENYVLLYRMGDFYETFDKDAEIISKALDIALTRRTGHGEKLAGIPYHALDKYLPLLIRKGLKVAICEQELDQGQKVYEKIDKAKVVKRKVVRVVTAGTLLESSLLDERKNNFLVALCKEKSHIGASCVDISTGEFFLTQFDGPNAIISLINFLSQLGPAEIILPPSLMEGGDLYDSLKLNFPDVQVESFEEFRFIYENAHQDLCAHFGTSSLEGFGVERSTHGITAAGAILQYLKETQKSKLVNITSLRLHSNTEHLTIDAATLKNLEIMQNIADGSSRGTLLEIFDHAVTSMGSRLLRRWLQQPLMVIEKIEERQAAVGEFHDKVLLREETRDLLKQIHDIERLVSRIGYGSANARDLIALKNSLRVVPEIRKVLTSEALILKQIVNELHELPEIVGLIERVIVDNPPAGLHDGKLIKPGNHSELDELREISSNTKRIVSRLEEEERRKTGIKNLKIKFNKVFGYFIEVTKSFKDRVPKDRYVRKQTLVNAERYITPELKEFEAKILSADEKIKSIEHELFLQTLDKIKKRVVPIQETATGLAKLDVLCTFAEVAKRNDYVKPTMNSEDRIDISEGRHPVVEKLASTERFVPNDALLDTKSSQIVIITGPNMGGKSTFIRQVALITLLAHVGSYVPAKHASIGIVDRIFSRIGAFDDLTKQRSTFMVEMNETANILNNATSRSLVILDELGRGTSTFDGLSIAWSVIEHLHNKIRCKTLFATHYHQLIELEHYLPRVKNYHLQIREVGDELFFLYKIEQGGSDKSFGIHVAKLAGLPSRVIDRARVVLEKLEEGDPVSPHLPPKVQAQKIKQEGRKVKKKERTQKKLFE